MKIQDVQSLQTIVEMQIQLNRISTAISSLGFGKAPDNEKLYPNGYCDKILKLLNLEHTEENYNHVIHQLTSLSASHLSPEAAAKHFHLSDV